MMMSDTEAVEQAVSAFYNLSSDKLAKLEEINSRIQNHKGPWGVSNDGQKNDSGRLEMPFVTNDPLIYEFLGFMHEENLMPVFDWTGWDEGSELFSSEDHTKYDNLDLETVLKLFYATSRKERFADGTLAWAFDSGGFLNLVNRLVELGVAHFE